MPFNDYFIKTSTKDYIEGYPKPPKYMMTDRMYNICIGFAVTALLASALLAYISISRINARSVHSSPVNTPTATTPAAKN